VSLWAGNLSHCLPNSRYGAITLQPPHQETRRRPDLILDKLNSHTQAHGKDCRHIYSPEPLSLVVWNMVEQCQTCRHRQHDLHLHRRISQSGNHEKSAKCSLYSSPSLLENEAMQAMLVVPFVPFPVLKRCRVRNRCLVSRTSRVTLGPINGKC
jgi:hypothetical protein